MQPYKIFVTENLKLLEYIYRTYIQPLNDQISFEEFCLFAYKEQY